MGDFLPLTKVLKVQVLHFLLQLHWFSHSDANNVKRLFESAY